MIYKKIANFVESKCCTLLGIGPMSKNCVDAVIDLANENDAPLILIASRRQIDSEEFGGGYVNNWTTIKYAEYVRSKNFKKNIILARDHGGPWQNDVEVKNNLSLKDAMASAKRSYKNDIDAGFQILHIDPSIDLHESPNVDRVLERVYELYDYCYSYAKKNNKDIIFEIGTEEQSGSTNTQEELEYTLASMKEFCKKNKFPFPSFVVIQAGTRVMETRNIGSFDSPIRVENEIPPEIQLPKMISICNKYGIYMKEHNTDYLSNDALNWHPKLGIHSANVAPEFGVAETRELIDILKSNNLNNLAEEFIKLSFSSDKWKKWMLSDGLATDQDKAIIAGHYIFSQKQFIELKLEASKKITNLDLLLKEAVRKSILRYTKAFRLH
tara:strand:- start:3178 stop:4326 length:1149 start_codon:yes stop_codon:yes gene_type:complete